MLSIISHCRSLHTCVCFPTSRMVGQIGFWPSRNMTMTAMTLSPAEHAQERMWRAHVHTHMLGHASDKYACAH